MTRSLLPIALVATCAVAACDSRPDESSLFTRVEPVSATPDSSTIVERALNMVRGAETACWIAAETFTSVELADALVDAQARGVDVRAFGDLDLRAQPGFERLSAGLAPVDGRIPVRFGDGPLSYNPELVDVIARDGDHNRMSHNFIVCDEQDLLTVTGGFGVAGVYQFGMHARSRDLGRDFADEFNQLFGGIDASTLSAFNGPLKSIADNREWYDSNIGRVEAYFGPQERLVKRMVDAVYGARGSVFVVAEELTSAPLADALRYKAEAGFDVVVIVGDTGVDVDSSRFARMQRELRDIPNARVVSAPNVAVNAVIVDALASPMDGLFHHGRALVTSEPLLAATSVVEGQVSVARASDAFTDANMFVFNRPVGEPSPAFDLVARHFEAILETSQ